MDKHLDRSTINEVFRLWLRYNDAMDKCCAAAARMCRATGDQFWSFHDEAAFWRIEARTLREEMSRLS